MAQPYLGEIRMFAGNFAPNGWLFCEGQLLLIAEHDTLFNLIGTTYGGDGVETFALPDLRGRIPIHMGNGYIQAETGGVEEVTLTSTQIPAHQHSVAGASLPAYGANPGSSASPKGYFPAVSPGNLIYGATVDETGRQMGGMVADNPGFMLQATGGSQPHSNMQPYLCVNFIISMFGIFPSP